MLELGAPAWKSGAFEVTKVSTWHKCQRFSCLFVGTCSGLLVGILWEGVGSKVALLEDCFHHNSCPFFAKL